MKHARSLARRCAAQALYQWQVSGNDLATIEQQFLEELAVARNLYRRQRAGQALTAAEADALEELLERYGPSRGGDDQEEADLAASPEALLRHYAEPEIRSDYFSELLHAVPRELQRIDAAIGEFSGRPVGDIDPVERAVLRIAVYELLFRPELPYRVAVNEAIDLAKSFGAAQSHKFVNGILDRVARKYRAAEAGQPARR